MYLDVYLKVPYPPCDRNCQAANQTVKQLGVKTKPGFVVLELIVRDGQENPKRFMHFPWLNQKRCQ